MKYSYKREQALQIATSVPLRFKSLLEKIILTSSILNRELALRGSNREMRLVRTISNSAWNLWTEMSAIIDLANLETEGFCLNLQPVAINALVHGMLDHAFASLRSRQQLLNLKLPPRSPVVMADQYRLEQVLTAILSKASAATAENGSIQISLIEQEKTVTLRIWGHPQLTKEDTANAPQDRYSNEETASIELALCRYLIKLHKGKLWLPNDKTSGNAFVLVLPSITN